MTQFVAMQPQQQVRPAFTVKKLEGETTKLVHIFDKKENKIKQKSIEVDAGYLVTFMKGHSIRCFDMKHVKAVGAGLNVIPLMDEEGNVKGGITNDAIAA